MHKILWVGRSAAITSLCAVLSLGLVLFSLSEHAAAQDSAPAAASEDGRNGGMNGAFNSTEKKYRFDLIDMEVAMSERSMGDPDAPVTMVEYSSLSCPHCAEFHKKTLPRLKEKYIDTGKVRLVVSEFPLDNAAMKATLLARCASPKRYFGLLELLFRNQEHWMKDESTMQQKLEMTGRMAGVGKEKFEACLHHQEMETELLKRVRKASGDWRIKSTPTFVLNEGEAKIEGALPYEEFVKTIDGLLEE